MQPQDSIPHGQTGKERWIELVAIARATREHASAERTATLVRVEQIKEQMRAVVLYATVNPKRHSPDYLDWTRDLRRGRTNILGGFFRLCDLLARRELAPNTGRGYALKLLALARDYVDVILPEVPATATAERPPMLRVHRRPVPARGMVVRRSA